MTVNTTEGAAYGAALLAGVGAGTWADVQSACKVVIKITGTTQPNLLWIGPYHRAYSIYQNLYPVLKPGFDKMAS